MSFSRVWAASRRWRRGISTSNGISLSDSSPSPSAAAAQILSYHEETKHAMDRYAKGPTSLDWKNQPNPFRTYNGAETTLLNTQPNATSERPRFSVLWNPQSVQSVPITMEGISHLLFYSLSISAWKKSGKSAWSLRVNPSSGNLHPTEAYVITPPHISQTSQPTLFHYEPKIHALEKRAVYSSDAFGPLDLAGSGRDFLLLGLSSIYWREAWKYGERAFRYCQLDIGHAIAAVRMAAATLGWRVNLLDDGFSTKQLDNILCLDRAQDFPSSQQEESQVLLLITRNGSSAKFHNKVEELAQRLKPLECYGVANSLSSQVRTWDAVNIAAAATVKPQTNTTHITPSPSNSDEHQSIHANEKESSNAASIGPYDSADLLTLIRQRRSALAFDPTRSEMPLSVFATIMKGIAASPQIAPFDCWPQEIQTSSTQVHASKLSGKEDISSFLTPAAASDEEEEDLSQWQDNHVHVLLYVHRVQDLAPGLYILVRGQDRRAHAALRQEMPKMMWSEVAEDFDEVGADGNPVVPRGLYLLLEHDVQEAAAVVSCLQGLAGDGAFAAGMLAPVQSAVESRGAWRYRRLHWQAGLIGHALHIHAEAANMRATGIGCFHDDDVHRAVCNMSSNRYMAIYHFAVGTHIHDPRIAHVEPYPFDDAVRQLQQADAADS